MIRSLILILFFLFQTHGLERLRRDSGQGSKPKDVVESKTRELFWRHNPVVLPPNSICNPSCPCCNSNNWPEFVQAVMSYNGPSDSCYTRNDNAGAILALVTCDPRYVAYMSYDYAQGAQYCGTSSSDRLYLTKSQGSCCLDILTKRVAETHGVCDATFDCAPPPSSVCDASCPCCDSTHWPEFVKAVENYDAKNHVCVSRVDQYGDLLALVTCDPRYVAYMSYDYAAVSDERKQYCGTSSSDRLYLTVEQGAMCKKLLLDQVATTNGVCGDTFECT